MLTPLQHTVDLNLFQEALQQLPEAGMKTTINQPTGNFFYDPWVLKDEYKGTVWETLYNSLPVSKGEARIIILDPGQAYQCHADIDDRYHLNILGDECFLVDLVREQMHGLKQDGIWYNMDAGLLHSAVNFGRTARVQLVIRHLLKRNKIEDPVVVTVRPESNKVPSARYVFDYYISPWLNSANKSGYISNFENLDTKVKFEIASSQLTCLKDSLPEGFIVE